MPMHELVRSLFQSRRLDPIRLPSFAGKGLSERMRSTGFALLGLTAAAGLGLVAIFAQPGFPLLEPVPLPSGPPAREAVGDAEKARFGQSPAASVHTAARQPAPVGPGTSASDGAGNAPRAETGSGQNPAPVAPEAGSPAPPASPASPGRGSGSGGGPRSPAPPAPPSPPAPAPVSTPRPANPPPEATTSSPTP